MTDLYERCPECLGPRTIGVCGRCRNQWYIPVGITKDNVAGMQRHLDEGAILMVDLLEEVARLQGLLREAEAEIERLEDVNEAIMDR